MKIIIKYKELFILLLIITLTLFLRTYKVGEYMTFLGDEGRDALVIKRILVEHDLPLLGPPSSVGNVYLGPLYYYMMAVPMAIFWLNPVSAVYMVALIGTVTVFLIFYLSRRWFGFYPAIICSLLYSVSYVTVTYSRSSWNPNPAPFFSLLAFLSLDQAFRTKNMNWLVFTGFAVAAATQMHYLSLILLPVIAVLWLFLIRQKMSNKILGTIFTIIAFVVTMLPLIIFDLRYNFMNYRGLVEIFTSNNSQISVNLFTGIIRIIPIYFEKLIGRFLAGENIWLTYLVGIGLLVPIVLAIKEFKTKGLNWPILVLGCWLGGGLIGLNLYKGEIYDHYLGFLNPAPFLLISSLVVLIIQFISDRKGLIKQVTISSLLVITSVLIIINLSLNPLLKNPGNQLSRTQEISRFVIAQSNGQPFNFALIAQRNYDAAYQFYLEQYGSKPKVVPIEVTEQLFVVCEDEVCQPVNHPKYEIAGFGWLKIDKEYEIMGIKVYRMIKNPSGQTS